MTDAITSSRPTRLAIGRVAMTGAFATLLFFFLGWAWAAIVSPHSAAFVGLFTTQPAGSAAALWIGGLCAFLVGGVFGALISDCYNLAGRVLGP
jgi:hypothetical protein